MIKSILKKIILLVGFLPFVAFAQSNINVTWSDEVVASDSGHGLETNLSLSIPANTPNIGNLMAIVFMDTDPDFDPPQSYAVIGSIGSNGQINFSAPGVAGGTYFLVAVVDSASYTGAFSPFSSGNQFQVFGLSQVAQSAGGSSGGSSGTTSSQNSSSTGSNASLSDYSPTFHIVNPIGQNFDILSFLQALFGNVVKIAIPFLVIFLIYSGFLFVEAQGNEEKLKHAKKNFLYVIIGAALVLGAWTIATAIKGTVDELQAFNIFTNIINLV